MILPDIAVISAAIAGLTRKLTGFKFRCDPKHTKYHKEDVHMYVNRGLLKANAKNTLSRGYWSCVLGGLVLALATGALGNAPSPGNYALTGKSGSGSDYFGQDIYSYDPAGAFGDLFGGANIPLYMLETFIAIVTITLAVSVLISIFLLQPLEVGCRKFYIDARKNNYDLGDMGAGFSTDYMNIVEIMFKRQFFIFLWSLLFIIPGIVKAYEYRMIPYILADDPGISSREAFHRSKQMMTGSKFDAFLFDLSFIGWFLLDAISFGLAGIFYVNPYYYNACTEFYALVQAKISQSTVPSAGAYDYNVSYQPQQSWSQPPAYTAPPSPESTSSSSDTVSAEDARPFNTPYGQ